MATDYRMTCYSNIEQTLKREGLTFAPRYSATGEPGGQLLGPYGLGSPYAPVLVTWVRDFENDLVEVTDLMTGEIYPLLGDLQKAEKLALQIACSYTNGGNK